MPEEEPHQRRRLLSPLVKLVVLAVVILGASLIVISAPIPGVDELRGMVDRAGWWAPVGFVAGYAALTLAPVPKNALSVAAGLLFGFLPGLLLVYCAAMLGASAAFWLGRALGREAVERFTGTRVQAVDEVLSRRGFAAVVGVRLVPVLPFTAINYSAGLTAVSWRAYFFGTLLGMLPGTVSFLALGAYGLDLGWPAQVGLAILGLLTLAGIVLAVRARRQRGLSDD